MICALVTVVETCALSFYAFCCQKKGIAMSRLPDTDFDSLLPPLILNRRGFMASTLISGFALAAGPAVATAIATDDKGLVAGQVRIPVQDGDIPAYRAAPAGKAAAPVALVVQEIFGVHEYIKEACRRMGKAG